MSENYLPQERWTDVERQEELGSYVRDDDDDNCGSLAQLRTVVGAELWALVGPVPVYFESADDWPFSADCLPTCALLLASPWS